MREFDRDIDVSEKADGLLGVTISPNWSINGNPNGGYLAALLARATALRTEKTETPILTANFALRAEPGPAEIRVERIAQSNRFDRFEARLIQAGRERVRAFATFAGKNPVDSDKRYEKGEPEIAPIEDCVLVPEIPNYTLYDRMDVRLDPSCAGWMTGNPSDKSEMKGWVEFKDERPLDVYSIILMADAFPPAVLASQGMVAWVPTIEFSINIRSIGQARRLKGVFRTHFIHGGMLEEDGELWDEQGDLAAVSRQFAQFRSNPR